MIKVVGLDYIGVVVDYNYHFDFRSVIESASRCADFSPGEADIAATLWKDHVREHQSSQPDAVRAFGDYFAELRGRIPFAKFDKFSDESDQRIASQLYVLREGSQLVLSQLRGREIKTAITTHIPRKEAVDLSLSRHGLRSYVWRIYASTGRDKETGELYKRLLEDAAQIGIGPDSVLIVDDKEANLRVLASLGCVPVLLRRDARIEHVSTDVKWVITDLAEILSLVGDCQASD